MTVAVAVERQTVEERSSYRLAVRAFLADIIQLKATARKE
jgi:hypothetical protein